MLPFKVSNSTVSWAHSTKNEHILMGIADFIRFTSYPSEIICCDFLLFARCPWSWHNLKKFTPVWGKTTLIPGHIPAKIKKLCLQKIFYWILKLSTQSEWWLWKWFMTSLLVFTTISKGIKIERCNFYHSKEKWE